MYYLWCDHSRMSIIYGAMEENSEDNKLEKDDEEFTDDMDDDQSSESRSTGTAGYVKGTLITCS